MSGDRQFERGEAAPPAWRRCSAPAGGCGMGRRRAVWTTAHTCGCGSPLIENKHQAPPPPEAAAPPVGADDQLEAQLEGVVLPAHRSRFKHATPGARRAYLEALERHGGTRGFKTRAAAIFRRDGASARSLEAFGAWLRDHEKKKST